VETDKRKTEIGGRQGGGDEDGGVEDTKKDKNTDVRGKVRGRGHRLNGTSTATLKSTMDTLVLRCQQTCTVVLPR